MRRNRSDRIAPTAGLRTASAPVADHPSHADTGTPPPVLRIALGIGAIGASLVGLHRVLGLPGIGLGAAVIMLLGNPLSGVSGAPEMLPAGWGALGQLLPPGAAGSLLRSTAFLDGAGAWGPALVLGTWLVVGVALALVPRREA
ncbi:hypothetical protein [Serinicoccus marinus]|uniref:hypothetical protein n=1 Tax=Serinicoccus marinus TaxID=247333 RepID=UPI0024926CCC|nr:hypothetical protein [Serinicoccus marinus]